MKIYLKYLYFIIGLKERGDRNARFKIHWYVLLILQTPTIHAYRSALRVREIENTLKTWSKINLSSSERKMNTSTQMHLRESRNDANPPAPTVDAIKKKMHATKPVTNDLISIWRNNPVVRSRLSVRKSIGTAWNLGRIEIRDGKLLKIKRTKKRESKAYGAGRRIQIFANDPPSIFTCTCTRERPTRKERNCKRPVW